MKFFLAVSTILFVGAQAQAQECKSVWIYQPFKSCQAAGNELDMSSGLTTVDNKAFDNGPMGGGNNPTRACNELAARFNSTTASHKDVATATTNGESTDRSWNGDVKYTYHCRITVKRYSYKTAPNKQCGVEDTWSTEDVNKSLEGLKGTPICLSCDNVNTAKDRLACLKDNIENVLGTSPAKVRVRPSEVDAVKANVDGLVRLQSKFANTFDINEANKLSELQDKIEKIKSELR